MAYSEEEVALLTTLHYGAIFDFPMREDEIVRFLMRRPQVRMTRTSLASSLVQLQKKKLLSLKSGYYCLSGNEHTITLRKKRARESCKKLVFAKEIISCLAKLPTVSLIGISGGLAMENADVDDDIDLFIITQNSTLFMTRLLILSVLEFKGLRRKRNELNLKNKICVNLLIDETALAWPRTQRDSYIAHEIVQFKPLFDRHQMYARFLGANQWVSQFLPDAFAERKTNQEKQKSTMHVSSFLILSLFEFVCRKLQMQLIKRHQTTEEITSHRLAFHPYNYRSNTLRRLNLNLKKAGLLTKI